MQGYELIGLTKAEFDRFAALRHTPPARMNADDRAFCAMIAKKCAAHATALNSTAAQRGAMKRISQL